MIRVIVTYSWDSEEHKEKVIGLVDFLRRKGFDAEVDRMLSQNQSAIDFNKMMHLAMTDYPKVIIILSSGYKERAEGFVGGVGKEFAMVLADIEHNPNKYILASFDGRGRNVAPLAFAGQEILELNESHDIDRLFRKLMDKPELEFSPVASTLPDLPRKEITPFEPPIGPPALITVKRLVIGGATGTQRSMKYIRLNSSIAVEVVNESSHIFKEYSIELHIPREIFPEYYTKRMENDRVVFDFPVQRPLYKGQAYRTEPVPVEFHKGTAKHALGAAILVKVFSEGGLDEKMFAVSDVFKVPGEHGMPAKPISIEHFEEEGFF